MNSSHYNASSLTYRLYLNENDLHDMLALLMEARLLTNDWHYPHVGELLWNYFMVACHLDPCQHIRLWHAADGRLVAYAILGEDPSFDVQVLPEFEWSGIEAEALTWAITFLAQLRQDSPHLWSGEMVSGARQDDPERIKFLEAHGFRYSGKFAEVNMLRSTSEPLPGFPVPASCQVRALAEVDEISDRAAAHREVWHPWTVGNVMVEDYHHFMQLPGYYRDLDVVSVTPDGSIAAFVNGWIDPLNRIGDFGPVGCRQAYRQQGFTRLALLESLRRMRSYGMDRVCISTGISNTPALNLYQSIGFTPVNRYLDYVQTG